MNVETIPLDLIDPCPDQPRKAFDEASIDELAASILARGLDQPITLRPVGERYEIVSGERRWRAHRKLALATILAMVRPMSALERDTAALVENVQRRDLSPMEEARAYQRMLLAHAMTITDLSRRIGKSEGQILRRIQLVDLRPEYQQLVGSQQLEVSYATELSRLRGSFQDAAFQRLTSGEVRNLAHAQAIVDALFVQQEQPELFTASETGELSTSDAEAVEKLERLIDLVANLAAAGFDRDNRIIAAKRIPANRMQAAADKLAAIARALDQMVEDLRRAQVMREAGIAA